MKSRCQQQDTKRDALTILGNGEEGGDERVLGGRHELHHVVVQRIFILVQPSGDVVAHLQTNVFAAVFGIVLSEPQIHIWTKVFTVFARIWRRCSPARATLCDADSDFQADHQRQ